MPNPGLFPISQSLIIRKNMRNMGGFVYDWGMASLESYLDQQLAQGRAYFSKEEASVVRRH